MLLAASTPQYTVEWAWTAAAPPTAVATRTWCARRRRREHAVPVPGAGRHDFVPRSRQLGRPSSGAGACASPQGVKSQQQLFAGCSSSAGAWARRGSRWLGHVKGRGCKQGRGRRGACSMDGTAWSGSARCRPSPGAARAWRWWTTCSGCLGRPRVLRDTSSFAELAAPGAPPPGYFSVAGYQCRCWHLAFPRYRRPALPLGKVGRMAQFSPTAATRPPTTCQSSCGGKTTGSCSCRTNFRPAMAARGRRSKTGFQAFRSTLANLSPAVISVAATRMSRPRPE